MKTKNSDLFYRCYDGLYFSKNYAGETDSVVSLVRNYYPEKIKKVLEIGAGTGNHTLEMAKYKFSVTAIDIDEKMIFAASKKISRIKFPNVKLVNVPVEALKEKNFNFVIAGFNVVNYLPDFNSLLSFFKSVGTRLKPKGLLIFDCWNGVAAIMNPPKTKIIQCKSGENFVHCTIQSETDFMAQKTKLTYNLSVKNEKGKEIESGTFSFEQMLWTPMELSHCINNAGLKILKCSRHFQPEIAANENDWKIMYVCQKRS